MTRRRKSFSFFVFAFLSFPLAAISSTEKIYWCDTFHQKIRRCNLDGSQIENLISSGIQSPRALALNPAEGKMYWVDWWGPSIYSSIHRANLDGSNPEMLLESPALVDKPRSLAVDSQAGKLYWIEKIEGVFHVRRCNLNGNNLESFPIQPGPVHVNSIALDPQAGKIYSAGGMINLGGTGRIYRFNFDGTNLETLVTIPPPAEIDYVTFLNITLDLQHGQMYWAEHSPLNPSPSIRRANLDGTNVSSLYTSEIFSFPRIIALDISTGKIYGNGFDGIQRGSMYQFNQTTQSVLEGLGTITGLALDLAPQTPRMIDSFPPHLALDARQPHALQNSSQLEGWKSIELYFDRDITAISPDDFSLTEIGADGVAPSIESLTNLEFNSLRLDLNESIDAGAWTCLEYLPSATKSCVVFLPGDVNGDRTAAPFDILALINHLNGVVSPPYPIWQSDLNRSGVMESSDILRLIDLLNGAEAFEAWNGVTLPAAP